MSGKHKHGNLRSRIVGEGVEAPDQLLANPLNWRTHPKEQVDALEGLLREVGWVQRVIVNRTTGHIVDGHARVELALRRSEPSVPVLYVALTEEEERLVLASLDPIGGLAGTDAETLARLLEGVETTDPALQALLDGLAGESATAGGTEGLTDPDDTPELQAEPVTKTGDVWLLGKHRVMCGDSTDAGSVALLMNGKSADVTFTSPPYNANTKAGDGDIFTSKKSKKLYTDGYSDNLQSDAYVEFASKVLDTCFEVTSGFIFWNVSYNANSRFEYIKQIVPRLEFLIEQICWKKSSSIPFKGSLMRDWEPIYLFSTNGERLGLNEVVSNHWTVSNTNSQTETHKACFPVELPSKGISLIKPKTNIVFDPFGGSGTTMIACEKHGRHARLMELDPRYCDVIVKRWQEFTGKQATLEATGATFAEVEADSGLAVAEDV